MRTEKEREKNRNKAHKQKNVLGLPRTRAFPVAPAGVLFVVPEGEQLLLLFLGELDFLGRVELATGFTKNSASLSTQ